MKIAVTFDREKVEELLRQYDAVAVSHIGNKCTVFTKSGKLAHEFFLRFNGNHVLNGIKLCQAGFAHQINDLIPKWRQVGFEVSDRRPSP